MKVVAHDVLDDRNALLCDEILKARQKPVRAMRREGKVEKREP